MTETTPDGTGRRRDSTESGVRFERLTLIADDALSPDDRFELWRHHVRANHGSEVVVSIDDLQRFHGQIHVRRLSNFEPGGMQVVGWESRPIGYGREDGDADKDGDDALRIVFPRTGAVHLEQHDDRVTVRPGQAGIVSWLQHTRFMQADDTAGIILNIPADVLPPALRYRPPMLLDPHRVITQSLSRLVETLARHPEPMSPEDFLFLYDEIFRLVGKLLDQKQATELDELARLVTVARSLVGASYWDPDLTVESLADRMNVQRRRLKYAFDTLGARRTDTSDPVEKISGPGTLIRETRLARAHEQLIAGDGRTVADIAYACGFSSINAFYEAFKAEYQTTPAKVRQTAKQRRQSK